MVARALESFESGSKKNPDRACKSLVCLELRASRCRKCPQNIDTREFVRKILRRRDLAMASSAGERVERCSRKLAGRVSILKLVYREAARLDVTCGMWKRHRPTPPMGS